jgi:hypothetical protein
MPMQEASVDELWREGGSSLSPMLPAHISGMNLKCAVVVHHDSHTHINALIYAGFLTLPSAMAFAPPTQDFHRRTHSIGLSSFCKPLVNARQCHARPACQFVSIHDPDFGDL